LVVLIKVVFNLTLYWFYLLVQKSCPVQSTDYSCFLEIYEVTQNPETKEYMTIVQYANNGSLLSYLDQNINKLTWRMKLLCLQEIAMYLKSIHYVGLAHCDLHGGNIVLYGSNGDTELFICDLGLSQSVNSRESNPTIQSVLPFIAPEVFHTCKFTQKSDLYSFGITVNLPYSHLLYSHTSYTVTGCSGPSHFHSDLPPLQSQSYYSHSHPILNPRYYCTI